MFGYVVASWDELQEASKQRYNSVYCGICRCMGRFSSQSARLALSYDCAFLALLHMSLYEPEETLSDARCLAHPMAKKPWTDNTAVRYAADMNVALAYYKALDDWHDDGKLSGKALSAALAGCLKRIEQDYPRQCAAIRDCIRELSRLEQENCRDIDRCANTFGMLMGQLLVWKADLWADTLRQTGHALGRFIYLADAACDFSQDEKKGRFNPYLAAEIRDPEIWKSHLVMAMGRCCQYYQRLPLVQDKDILDNILYSGVWTRLTAFRKEEQRGRSV